MWHFSWPWPPSQVEYTPCSFSPAFMISNDSSLLFRSSYMPEVTLGSSYTATHFIFARTVWGCILIIPPSLRRRQREVMSFSPGHTGNTSRIWAPGLDICLCTCCCWSPDRVGGEGNSSPITFLWRRAGPPLPPCRLILHEGTRTGG